MQQYLPNCRGRHSHCPWSAIHRARRKCFAGGWLLSLWKTPVFHRVGREHKLFKQFTSLGTRIEKIAASKTSLTRQNVGGRERGGPYLKVECLVCAGGNLGHHSYKRKTLSQFCLYVSLIQGSRRLNGKLTKALVQHWNCPVHEELANWLLRDALGHKGRERDGIPAKTEPQTGPQTHHAHMNTHGEITWLKTRPASKQGVGRDRGQGGFTARCSRR